MLYVAEKEGKPAGVLLVVAITAQLLPLPTIE